MADPEEAELRALLGAAEGALADEAEPTVRGERLPWSARRDPRPRPDRCPIPADDNASPGNPPATFSDFSGGNQDGRPLPARPASPRRPWLGRGEASRRVRHPAACRGPLRQAGDGRCVLDG